MLNVNIDISTANIVCVFDVRFFRKFITSNFPIKLSFIATILCLN